MFKIVAFSNSQIEFDLENEENLKMALYGSSDREIFIFRDQRPGHEDSLRKLSVAPSPVVPITAKCTNSITPLNLLDSIIEVGVKGSSLSLTPALGCDGKVTNLDSNQLLKTSQPSAGSAVYWYANLQTSILVQDLLIINTDTTDDTTRIETYDLLIGNLADITANTVCYTGTAGDVGGWRTCGRPGQYFAL